MPGVLYVQVEKLVHVLGLPSALDFSERFGGRRLYVPNPGRLGPEHPIAQAIGLEAAKLLAAEWKELEIMVPLCAEHLRRARDRGVRADQGKLSARAAAAKWRLTERHVFRIWSEPGEVDDEANAPRASQQNLF